MNAIDIIKKQADMKRLMLAVAMAALIVSHAEAAELKPESVISGDVVTVGDLFDGVTAHADYVLAPAPAPGKSMTLSARELQRVSDTFGLGWTARGPLDQLVVKSSSHAVEAQAVTAALKEKLAEKLPGRRFDLQVEAQSLAINLPETAPATVEVASIDYDSAKGSFTATLAAPSLADAQVRKTVTGRFHEVVQVPVLSAPLRNGEVISASDIEYVDLRMADLAADTYLRADQLAGFTPRRTIAKGRPIQPADIELPMMVKKGETVIMTLQNNRISLTLQGKALQDGAEGDLIRLVNPASNKVIEGVVSGLRSVNVRAVSDTLAMR